MYVTRTLMLAGDNVSIYHMYFVYVVLINTIIYESHIDYVAYCPDFVKNSMDFHHTNSSLFTPQSHFLHEHN